LEEVICNLCGSAQHRLCFEKAGVLSGQMFRIVCCENCGLVFVTPRLTPKAINSLYSESYFQGEGFDRSVRYVKESKSTEPSQDIVRTMRRISSICHPPAKILEVGPGMGGFMRLASAKGYDVQGLELSGFAVEQLCAQGLKVMQGVLPNQEISDHSVDVVVAIEVIEHLLDPMSFFKEVKRVLRPGGLFYYETGNIACEQAQQLGSEWNYIMPEGHLYYFSPQIMRKYLQHVGFIVAYPHWANTQRTAFRALKMIGLCNADEISPSGLRGSVSRWVLRWWDRLTADNDTFPMAIAP
jgi:2-polyprenyl-3-methyl-5-hydroxy-6-metoxy-1,4-benzoquinol methylase